MIASDSEHQRFFYPVEGGAPQPIADLDSADEIIGWCGNGRLLYVACTQGKGRADVRRHPTLLLSNNNLVATPWPSNLDLPIQFTFNRHNHHTIAAISMGHLDPKCRMMDDPIPP